MLIVEKRGWERGSLLHILGKKHDRTNSAPLCAELDAAQHDLCVYATARPTDRAKAVGIPNKWIFVLCVGAQAALRATRCAQLSRQCTRCSRVIGPEGSVLVFGEATLVWVIVTVWVCRRVMKERRV